MIKFISFGSGSSGNCYFLYTETDGLLIDTGVGIRTLKKHFRNYGLNMTMVHRILITHDHADHIKCVGSMSHDYHLPVFATKTIVWHVRLLQNSGITLNLVSPSKLEHLPLRHLPFLMTVVIMLVIRLL